MKTFVGGSPVSAVLLLFVCRTASADTVLDEPVAYESTSEGGGLDGTVNGILDHMRGVLDGTVRAVSREVVTGMSQRLSDAQSQCLTQTEQIAQLASQLSSLQSRLDTGLDAQTSALAAHNETVTEQMVELRSTLASQGTQLSEQSTQLSEQSAELARLGSGLTEGLADVAEGLAAHTAQLSALQNQLGRVPATTLRDCSDLPAGASSGVHILYPGLDRPVAALCDLDGDGGGWTVIQKRDDIQPRQNFYLDWHHYKWGFGELDGEFWWGLERLWGLTSQLDRRYEIRIDMEDFDGEKRHAIYQGFRIAPEADNYRLTAVNYTGDAGDNFTGHSGHPFSTKDRDNDTYGTSCAQKFHGAWWYTKCHGSNLNGKYLAGKHTSYADGVNWSAWRGYHYSLKTVTMKIRPTKKL
ncbi:Techylectin-5A [Amphibalanus amphitrite]|uniref:Techylectin-5A n=1 Tax=Amphibalanus amphitrite TaxID=1232801 RepID=A0A6A4WIP4_AMPAM|nr:Techylectin-5A [Amphibalanus amphitrite]